MSEPEQLLAGAVASGRIPGGMALIDRRGDTDVASAGVMSIGGQEWRRDAIVRIQSMSKVVLAVATLRLVEAGVVELDAPVERWLPELTGRQVLRTPEAELDDVVPADRPITVRDLLACQSGYGIDMGEATPIGVAMREAGVEAGPEPSPLGADDWLHRMADLPLTHQPGAGWRYHHSFMVLGILLGCIVGRPVVDHLRDDVFKPLGMVDTGFWVPEPQADRLPAAYKLAEGKLTEVDAAGGGHFLGDPGRDVSHGELVSTADDFLRLCRMLRDDGVIEGHPYLAPESVLALRTAQINEDTTTDADFFPGFWNETTWGFGVAVERATGRYGWSGGLGTDFVIDPDAGLIGILLTQVELGPETFGLVNNFEALVASGTAAQ